MRERREGNRSKKEERGTKEKKENQKIKKKSELKLSFEKGGKG